MYNNKKSLGNYLLTAVFFIVVVSIAIFFFRINFEGERYKTATRINEKKDVIDSYDVLRNFVEKNNEKILIAHKNKDYISVERDLKEYFSRKYISRGIDWRLEILSSSGELLKSFKSSDLDISLAVASMDYPIPSKDFITLRLIVGYKIEISST